MSNDPTPVITTDEDAFERLEARKRYLTHRIEAKRASDYDMTYDIAERDALQRIIDLAHRRKASDGDPCYDEEKTT